MHSPTQVDTLQPVQDEQCALDATELAERNGEPVLTWIGQGIAGRLGPERLCELLLICCPIVASTPLASSG